MTVRYDKATHNGTGATPGARALVNHWIRTTGLESLGIFNPRPPRGSATGFSVHAEGRASDLRCNALAPDELETGNRYAAWLIENSEALQVQRIIWNHNIWTSGFGWKAYTGRAGPHTDHLHVELNWDGANVIHPLLGGAGFDAGRPLPEEDDLTPEQFQELLGAVRAEIGGTRHNVVNVAIDTQQRLSALEQAVAALASDAQRIREAVRRDDEGRPPDLVINTALAIEKHVKGG